MLPMQPTTSPSVFALDLMILVQIMKENANWWCAKRALDITLIRKIELMRNASEQKMRTTFGNQIVMETELNGNVSG